MKESFKKNDQIIQNKINDLREKTRILSALVPLNGNPVPVITWEELG